VGVSWEESWPSPAKSGILQAQARLGHELLAEFFGRPAHPLAAPFTPGLELAGRRVAIRLPTTTGSSRAYMTPTLCVTPQTAHKRYRLAPPTARPSMRRGGGYLSRCGDRFEPRQ